MFEKEAIRHAFEDTIGVKCLLKPVEDFTYEELSDEQQEKAYDFQRGAEFGYNKANDEDKWHFVKDELPISDKDKYYFVVDKWNEPMIARFYEGIWSNYSTIEDVIAWKEIVLPKEIKEND